MREKVILELSIEEAELLNQQLLTLKISGLLTNTLSNVGAKLYEKLLETKKSS